MNGFEVQNLKPFRHDLDDNYCQKHGTDLYSACPECYQEEQIQRLIRFKDVVAENASLRAALGAVEWVGSHRYSVDGFEIRGCPWCRHWEGDGHASDCIRQAALALPLRGSTNVEEG